MIALTVPARCPRGHRLDRRTAILARGTVRCALCDRVDCYRAHFGHEPPASVLAPAKFKAVGQGITAAARATFLSETEPTTTEDTETDDMSHPDPVADRRQFGHHRDETPPPPRTTWRDFHREDEQPSTEVEQMDVRDMGIEAWRRQQAYMRWSHARGDFGV